ncbi:peptidoglycan-binding protein [Alsobacter sp. SYSU M60028]|uniref:Peptidoglycan-binding protein n=1 Tax=Alsobacter ponti TaxID=2962936 RepID=A0ABT1LJC2_9HYPH|nr:peptidoglycan-binding protein [Alsobacter ponti]MCP8940820.1 peptidoglycan-binding protein [Alsobacter ponti]
MIPIDGDALREIAPRMSGPRAAKQKAIFEALSGSLAATLDEAAINTRLRAAHFLAQICHESDGFCTCEEYASGSAYEGRRDLGNLQPNDGRRFKGRGLIQLTGRANYRAFGARLGVDLEADPEAAADPKLSLRIACLYWTDRNINPKADRDDLIAVTRAINGGLNGLDARRAALTRAKTVLARLAAAEVMAAEPTPVDEVARRGCASDSVGDLQRMLHDLGFPVAVDGSFGPATELAVMRFQMEHGLEADGIVGAQTWSALRQAQAPSRAA